jgi:hypothetical protein
MRIHNQWHTLIAISPNPTNNAQASSSPTPVAMAKRLPTGCDTDWKNSRSNSGRIV